ncbi:UNVERIFIED_CONTAM: hypothetical protein Sindi_2115500 [Sesamum indicum]
MGNLSPFVRFSLLINLSGTNRTSLHCDADCRRNDRPQKDYVCYFLEELAAEISVLEKQRDELEAQLKKEDELAKSITSCRAEADVLSTWINFLEDTWSLQCSYVETKEKEVNAELERHEGYFTKLVGQLLSSYEKELRPFIDRIGKYVENLKSLNEGLAMTSKVEADVSEMLNPRRNLEEEYLDYEAKIITTFSIVDNMREQFYAQQGKISSKENLKVKELFDNIEKLREEFESIERPTLEMENPTKETDISSGEKQQESVTNSFTEQAAKELNAGKVNNDPQPPPVKSEQVLDPEAELAKLESEFGKVNRDYSAEEIGEWEFDELERELRSGDSSRK